MLNIARVLFVVIEENTTLSFAAHQKYQFKKKHSHI